MKEKFEKVLKDAKEKAIVVRDWVVKNRFEIMAVSYVVLYLVYEETCKENKRLMKSYKRLINEGRYEISAEGFAPIKINKKLNNDEMATVNMLLGRGFTLEAIVDIMNIRSQE